ncbi:MAG TPA: transposase [Saprospiraceae bacterium]|nr:transposase [Saprospiraceae bacterium]
MKELTDENAWHNQFYREVTSRIEETIFRELYSDRSGRPNAPVRVLTAMILLKEGQGWTDEQLYENSRYNMKGMRALGLTNLNDEVPVASTYYDFKVKLDGYHADTGINLFDEVFKQITRDQIGRYKIKGSEIRMDSKLIQSNIRNFTRLQKLIQGIQVFQRSLGKEHKTRLKKKDDKAFLEEILSKTPENHTYGMGNLQKEKWVERMGFLLRKIVNLYSTKDSKYYDALKTMFLEQYEYEEKTNVPPRPKQNGDIPADTVQSIHDTEASYRKKGQVENQQQVRGYSANITENCSDEELSLITDVRVEKATYSDDAYLTDAVVNTEQLTQTPVTDIWTDGGYDSIANRKQFGEWQTKTWHLSNLKGANTYSIVQGANGEIIVTDLITNTTQKASLAKNGKYRISSQRKTQYYVYFDQETIATHLILNEVRPVKESSTKRANVEATIHQVFCSLSGAKTRYRGRFRNSMFVIARCIWVNFKRIAEHLFKSPSLNLCDLFASLSLTIWFLEIRREVSPVISVQSSKAQITHSL